MRAGLSSAAPCRARSAIACVAILAELARRAFAATRPPLVPLPVAEVAGVRVFDDDVDERLAAELLGQCEGRRLVDPHERRLQHEAPVHSQAERHLQRLDRIVAAVRVAGEIGLAHSAHERPDPPAVGKRSGGREEKQVPPRNEGVGQARFGHPDLDVLGHRGRAERTDDAQIEHVILAELPAPRGKALAQLGEDDRAALELDRVALPVAKADGLDAREIRERPREAGGRILAAGEKNQSLLAHGSVAKLLVHGSFPVFVLDCKTPKVFRTEANPSTITRIFPRPTEPCPTPATQASPSPRRAPTTCAPAPSGTSTARCRAHSRVSSRSMILKPPRAATCRGRCSATSRAARRRTRRCARTAHSSTRSSSALACWWTSPRARRRRRSSAAATTRPSASPPWAALPWRRIGATSCSRARRRRPASR